MSSTTELTQDEKYAARRNAARQLHEDQRAALQGYRERAVSRYAAQVEDKTKDQLRDLLIADFDYTPTSDLTKPQLVDAYARRAADVDDGVVHETQFAEWTWQQTFVYTLIDNATDDLRRARETTRERLDADLADDDSFTSGFTYAALDSLAAVEEEYRSWQRIANALANNPNLTVKDAVNNVVHDTIKRNYPGSRDGKRAAAEQEGRANFLRVAIDLFH